MPSDINQSDDSLIEDAFGPLDPVWVPDTPTSSGLPVIDVPVTDLYGDKLFGRPRGVRVDQGTSAWLRLILFSGQSGAPVMIQVGGYSTPPTVEVRYREASGYDPRVYVPDDGDIPSLQTDGKAVLLPLPTEVKNQAGVFSAQVRVTDDQGIERNRSNFTALVDRGLWLTSGLTPGDCGPPTFDEIRIALRDHPGVNRLLNNYEFDASEIGQSLVGAVQTFNQTFPHSARNLTTISWPGAWRRQLLDGCLSYLFSTAAAYFRRGHLPYNAAGLAIDDLGKEKEYLGAAQMYRERYDKWCRFVKTQISIDAGWGSVSSGTPWGAVAGHAASW